ncbi:hypothetical protein [Photorhabdus luminescens]|uniref:hypothetical protein n=1 Tax=Photorhabdus luminescens TaxID=29488 RepID=UPI0022408F3B|nr:hypothetical protein [Photorhabdus luminescens]MCW7764325.1 hypothetical protein [Photorhabdus luminescens subsp. venezuelensis]
MVGKEGDVKGNYLFLLAIFAVAVFLFVGTRTNNPTPSNAVYFAKKQVKKQMKDPDSTLFEEVGFYSDDEPQGKRISGYVCGKVNSKNSFGAYTGYQRFWVKISVYDNGRSASMSLPEIEESHSGVVKASMDVFWKEHCN